VSLLAHPQICCGFHLQGAARRINAQRKIVEVESVASTGKAEAREVVKKLFRAEVNISSRVL
jgi:outer membrane lipopolysaccharide assembly protein LptE/RlpB